MSCLCLKMISQSMTEKERNSRTGSGSMTMIGREGISSAAAATGYPRPNEKKTRAVALSGTEEAIRPASLTGAYDECSMMPFSLAVQEPSRAGINSSAHSESSSSARASKRLALSFKRAESAGKRVSKSAEFFRKRLSGSERLLKEKFKGHVLRDRSSWFRRLGNDISVAGNEYFQSVLSKK